MELIIYASTLWIWIRGGACTEIVKPFKCFLHTSDLQCHMRLDGAIQCTFMKMSWTTSLSFVLTFCSLSKDEITDELVCALVRELQVNQSHQKLEWVWPFMSDFSRGACWDCSVIPMPVYWNMREDLHGWRRLQTLSYTFGTCMDGCAHPWPVITI